MSEDEAASERWRQAFAALGERAVPGPECPQPDRLWATATGESPLPERHEIIAHTASCASCATAFRLALELSRDREEAWRPAGQGGEAVRFPPPIPRRPWVRWAAPLAAVAAALILVVLVPTVWWDRPQPYRGGEAPEIRSQVPEGAVLPRERAELRWTAGPPGSRYEIRVLTHEGREIAVEAGLEAPRYRIPPSALAGVREDTVLYWQVKALSLDGKSAVSKTFSVRLR